MKHRASTIATHCALARRGKTHRSFRASCSCELVEFLVELGVGRTASCNIPRGSFSARCPSARLPRRPGQNRARLHAEAPWLQVRCRLLPSLCPRVLLGIPAPSHRCLRPGGLPCSPETIEFPPARASFCGARKVRWCLLWFSSFVARRTCSPSRSSRLQVQGKNPRNGRIGGIVVSVMRVCAVGE